MYHQPPHPHHAKRRKKRPIHGLKTAEVTRGKSGYGFTISGQHPCILSCIVAGSPADCVGLKPGDYLVSVNGLDVSKAGHDEVVRMVGMSTGTLTLQVAENYNSSDSSDDEYNHRTKSSKYPNRVRVRSAARLRFEDKMDKIVAGLNQRDRHCPDGHSHDPTLRPLPQPETMHKHGHSRPRLHMPVGAENSEIATVSVQRHQHGSSSDGFKVPFQKSYSVPNVERGSSKQAIHRVEPKHAFIKSTSHSHRKSRQTGHREPSSHQHVYNNFSPASLQQIINHSLHSYSEANEAFILQTEDSDALSDSTDDDEELNLLPQNSNIKVIVGYIGSIEMPSDANVPHVRIQSIRNAVRRLRVEQKINTLVLMHVHQEGIALSNAAGSTVAEYPVDRIAFSGVCPDDKRFFGIVTLHSKDEPDGTVSHENFVRSSSCHVFMVDPEMNAHNIHAQKAKTFGIRCTVDPHSQRCLEFPRSTTPIILSISNLYQDRLEGALETDLARSQVFANPNRPAERSNSNSSNSDSGLGLGREDNGHDRAVGPDLQLEQPLPPSGQVRWSGNTIHLTHGPIRHLSPDIHTASTLHHPLSALSTDANRSFHTSTSSDECFKAAEKLNVRAMSESVLNSPASPRDNLEKDYSAEILRQSMQKLFQARQKHTHEKQSTSDQDSQNLNENNSTKNKQQIRPISAPFKCLSGESNVDGLQKVDSSKVESIEMNLADKLSPRAFLSSAFTPVGSASSAFRKVKSHSGSLTNQIRSPSAPPIPNYHGDDEDSDDDDVNLIIERFERDRALGLTVEAEPRRYSEGLNMEKKRDLDKKNSVVNTEKWTKGGGSVRQKPRQRTSLSQSHESLVVIDTDPLNHRLSAANSVNSIIHHVKEEEEKEEVGRVAGWAVNFDKLLRDISGLHVFTEFLKKEFSEENIIFWTTVEKYKQITNQDMRKAQAKDIFNKHLSVRASEPVNIDSVARQQADSQMDIPTPQIFDMAQHQIYQLMKQDSYARFLKSELYKTCLIKEMEGKPLDIPQEENKKGKESDEKEKDSKKKSKGKENEDKEKRRRSLLPWRQKASKSSSKSTSDAENKKSKGKEKEKEKDKEAEVNNNRKSTSATTALPSVTSNSIPSVGGSLSTTRKEIQANRNEEPVPDTDEQPKFCRVILPDGSTTVVCTKAGQTINIVLGKLCEKRNMTIASVDIFLLGSDKPLNLTEDISVLGSKEVIIEKRVLFRMDLPNKKSIGVKAKPNRVILDVFKPILHKYGFRIDSIEVYLSGHTAVLDLEGLVSSLDNQRVVVVSKDDCQAWTVLNGSFITSTRPPLPNKLNKYGYPSKKNRGNSLDDITNQIFGDLMQGKSELAHNFDELGILDPDKTVKDTKGVDPLSLGLLKKESTAMAAKEHGKTKMRQKVTFALQKNEVRRHPNDDDDLCHLLKTASNRSLDDQRGVSVQDLELPEFLRKSERPLSGRESAPPMLMRDLSETASMKRSADVMASDIFDFVHTENDKFVAYRRERIPERTSSQNNLDSFKPFVTSPSEKLDFTDRSFSTEGVIPTEEEADAFFDFPPPSNTDFDDPLLTEKSLKDIGFSYSHNKYLARSHNFVSCTSHQTRSGSPSVKNLDSPLMSHERFSPNRTLCGDDSSELSDSLDATVIMSPRLLMSPRNDSDQNKENTAISSTGLNLKSVQRTSRHTLIHSNSPITTQDQTDSLSAVDTDSKITRTKLSTPKKLHSSGTATAKQNVVYLSDSEADVTYV